MGTRSKTSRTRKIVGAQGEGSRHAATIDMLPDDVLLEIFHFHRNNHHFYSFRLVWKWHLLVHVCRRWRQLVFASPQRLKLQILCTHKTLVRKNLNIWPAFPIAIDYHKYSARNIEQDGVDNVIAALGQPDRVCKVRLNVSGPQLAKMATVMQEPFQVLTHLDIASADDDAQDLPDEFLGGSAPCLQEIILCNVPFPALPTLLLSTRDLVTLTLSTIPPTGYISPEAMVLSLAALSRLETLLIGFQSSLSPPDPRGPPSVTRIVLPALTTFTFQGAAEYLEDFVAQIDSPQLDRMHVHYLNRAADVPVARLSKFVFRSVGYKLTLFGHAHVRFSSDFFSFILYANHPSSDCRPSKTLLSFEKLPWQVSNIIQVFGQFSATEILTNVVHLNLQAEHGFQLEDMDYANWLLLFHQFSNVQTLHVSQELAEYVALTMEDITSEMVTEVLPSLGLICLTGQSASSVEKFIAARGLSGRPVTVVGTLTEFRKVLESSVGE